MKNILLVEDEVHVVSFIKKGLSEEGFNVSVALDGKAGLQMFQNGAFDLLILDIMLPEMNGLHLCTAIRKQNKTVPILFLTALGTSENVVLGLETGADDYLVKPFKFIELLARGKSLLRRIENASNVVQSEPEIPMYNIADVVVNDYSKEVFRDGKLISLTSTEYRLLLHFIQNQNKVLSRTELLEHVWGVNFDMGTNVVDVYVNYLRKKLESKSDDKLIHTVIGMGYVMKEN
jgi:two-component system copper resistance phosphate regulon response regulator CusR